MHRAWTQTEKKGLYGSGQEQGNDEGPCWVTKGRRVWACGKIYGEALGAENRVCRDKDGGRVRLESGYLRLKVRTQG